MWEVWEWGEGEMFSPWIFTSLRGFQLSLDHQALIGVSNCCPSREGFCSSWAGRKLCVCMLYLWVYISHSCIVLCYFYLGCRCEERLCVGGKKGETASLSLKWELPFAFSIAWELWVWRPDYQAMGCPSMKPRGGGSYPNHSLYVSGELLSLKGRRWGAVNWLLVSEFYLVK